MLILPEQRFQAYFFCHYPEQKASDTMDLLVEPQI